MAATGYTPISLYYSTTGAAVPSAANLANGELAINITDGKLYYKDNLGAVKLLANAATTSGVTSITFGATGLTPSTATTGVVSVAGTLGAGYGGTGQNTYTVGDLLIASGATTLSKLPIGTNGYILTSNGTTAVWSVAPSSMVYPGAGIPLSTGSAWSTSFDNASNPISVPYGGTGKTSFTAYGVIAGGTTSTGALQQVSGTGSAGQVLTSNGAGALPTWQAAAGGVTISNDTATSTNVYPAFMAATSGTASTIYTSNAKLLYKPSTGELKSTALVAGNGIIVNNDVANDSYTIATGSNGLSVGPITVASGATITVSSGQRWLVL